MRCLKQKKKFKTTTTTTTIVTITATTTALPSTCLCLSLTTSGNRIARENDNIESAFSILFINIIVRSKAKQQLNQQLLLLLCFHCRRIIMNIQVSINDWCHLKFCSKLPDICLFFFSFLLQIFCSKKRKYLINHSTDVWSISLLNWLFLYL